MSCSELNLGLGAGVRLAVSDAGSTKTGALSAGEQYLVTADTPTHVVLAPVASATATVDDFLLAAGEQLALIPWREGNGTVHDAIAGICPAGGAAGNVYLSKRRSV